MNVMNSLFGVPKEQTFDQSFAAALPAFRGVTLPQLAAAGAYSGAKTLGKGLMSGLGVEDPEMKDSNLIKETAMQLQAAGISPQSPEGLAKMAEVFNAQGRSDLAQQAIISAQALKMKQTEEQLKQAQISTQQAQAEYYKAQTNTANEKYVYKQDSMGNVMVYDKQGNLVRIDRAPIFGMAGGGAGQPSTATPGINPNPANRPPLSTFQR